MLQLHQLLVSRIGLFLLFPKKVFTFIFREYEIAMNRIAKMIRGIGDPLVAVYARCYLVRVGITVCNDKHYMKDSFMDFLGTYHTVSNIIKETNLNMM